MYKAVFLDWFNTLAHYQPEQHEIHWQALKHVGVEVSLKDVMRGVAAANKYLYEENTRLPLGRRDPGVRFEVYRNYEYVILDEIGVQVSGETLTTTYISAPSLYHSLSA